MPHEIYILWDHAHIWGLMALRTLRAMKVPCRPVKATEIAQGLLSGKPPALLLVPGGTARLKAQALGEDGLDAIRHHVRGGGSYLGFCGGAGLGLSDSGGLALCPWTRATYSDRLQHLVSGHVLSQVATHALCPPEMEGVPAQDSLTPLPVWWPGRFAPHPDDSVTVLATYQSPGHDLCLADIPLSSLPRDTVATWQEMYGVNMRADFLHGQPCVLTGQYGQGRYVLSYSHLETPRSPAANGWLAHLLYELAGISSAHTDTGHWEVDNLPLTWEGPEAAALLRVRQDSLRLMRLGVEHNLLFKRTPWLYGWRTGIPGAALNNIHIAVCTALSLPLNDAANAFRRAQEDNINRLWPLFAQGVEGYLLAERLATTLSSTLPDVVDRRGLKVQREALFGPPMTGGGIYHELIEILDELVFLLA